MSEILSGSATTLCGLRINPCIHKLLAILHRLTADG
jgi:hypothetical protein